MADETKQEKKQEKKAEAQSEAKPEAQKPAPAKGKGLVVWLIPGVVILAGATGGFALSQLMGGTFKSSAGHSAPTQQSAPSGHSAGSGHGESSEKAVPQTEIVDPVTGETVQKSWVYDKLDTIIANLDEPGVARYIRVTVILELNPQLDPVKGQAFLDGKKAQLQDWLTTYLAGLNLENVRGSRNLNRIKMEVRAQFNQLLFGQDKTYVEKVLFKEFAIQ